MSKTISIALCDSGYVDSNCFDGIINTIMYSNLNPDFFKIDGIIHIVGNQIAQQRQKALTDWINLSSSNWLLCVDSDIVININSLTKLINSVNEETHKVVSGIYFISPNMGDPLMKPIPSIFYDDLNKIYPIHPFPNNQLIKIDNAGFGFLLIHRSVVNILLEKEESMFDVFVGLKSQGEDVSFFRKIKKHGIQAYAHTGALVDHMKTFNFNIEYYNNWWEGNKVDLNK